MSSQIAGLIVLLGGARSHLHQAEAATTALQLDFQPDPAKCAAIALITSDGSTAGLWEDVCYGLAAAAVTLSDAAVVLDDLAAAPAA
jgi:hypothetical protein